MMRRGWAYHITIADILHPLDRDVDDKEAQKLAKAIAKRIRENDAFKDHRIKSDLREIADRFDSEVFDQGDLNSILNDLYDLGDTARIWIGNTPFDLKKKQETTKQ